LADNPEIGLDETTRNSSAIFLTWSKFPDLENGVKPEPGWYANYVYAMFPKTKGHLTKKCEGYKAESTPFRKHGRKAYVRGYMHGFCHKTNMFAPDAKPTSLEFVPFVEIMEIDWAAYSNDSKDIPATPPKKIGRPGSTSTGKRRIAFDPFGDGDSGIGSSRTLEEKLLDAKSENQSQTTGRT
jgi:hypothetical protein